MKIVVGISTYNGSKRVKKLLSSIYDYTYDDDLKDIKVVVVDDGTPYEKEVKKLQVFCDRFQVHLLKHQSNRGISAAWNSAARAFDGELIVLLNDDIQICHPSWLKIIKFFLWENKFAGSVSLPIFQIDPRTGLPKEGFLIPNIRANPIMEWTPVGQAFAFRKEVYDITGGFNEDFHSFYEECSFGYEMASRGYPSYVLPFPPVHHWGSETFALNKELSYTVPIPKLPMERYRELLKSKFLDKKIEPLPGKVYRLEYSRVLFSLKWKCNDLWDAPQNEVENRLKKKKRLIRWMDKDENTREDLI